MISRQPQSGYFSIKKMVVYIGTGRYIECCRDIFHEAHNILYRI